MSACLTGRQTCGAKLCQSVWCGSDPFTAVGFGGKPKDNSIAGNNQLTTVIEGHSDAGGECLLMPLPTLYVLRIRFIFLICYKFTRCSTGGAHIKDQAIKWATRVKISKTMQDHANCLIHHKAITCGTTKLVLSLVSVVLSGGRSASFNLTCCTYETLLASIQLELKPNSVTVLISVTNHYKKEKNINFTNTSEVYEK